MYLLINKLFYSMNNLYSCAENSKVLNLSFFKMHKYICIYFYLFCNYFFIVLIIQFQHGEISHFISQNPLICPIDKATEQYKILCSAWLTVAAYASSGFQ